MKWNIRNSMFYKTYNTLHILPEFSVWYIKEQFLETGVYTPAFGFRFAWIKWKWAFSMQKGY